MKTALKVVGIVVLVLLVIAIALPFFLNVNSFRPEIESKLGAALGRTVKVGNLSLSILSGSVGADQLSISDDPKFSSSPFITAKSLKVGVQLFPLIFSKKLNVTHLVIDEPSITLLRNPTGAWNFSSLGSTSAQASPAKNQPGAQGEGNAQNVKVDKLDVTDGTISLGSVPAKRKPLVYDKVNISVSDFSTTTAFPVTVSVRTPGGGGLKLDGTAGPINSTDTSLTPLQAKVNISKLDLSQSAMVDPSLGIAGSADFDGSLNSDGKAAKANGVLKLSSLKLVPKGSPAGYPVQVQYALTHDLARQSGQLTQGDVSIGKALAKLTGTYEARGESTYVRMKLAGDAMPVDDLEAMLPSVGVVLPSGSKLKGGTLSMSFDATGPLDNLVTTGWIRLGNTALTGFNLGSKMAAISALSGKSMGNDTSIQNLSSNVHMTTAGTRLDNVSLVVPSLGTVAGAGTVSPNGALDFKMGANLSGTTVTSVTQMAGLGGKGTGNIPFKIEGTTSDPKFVPDVGAMATSQLKNLTKPGVQGGQANPVDSVMGLFGKKKKPPK